LDHDVFAADARADGDPTAVCPRVILAHLARGFVVLCAVLALSGGASSAAAQAAWTKPQTLGYHEGKGSYQSTKTGISADGATFTVWREHGGPRSGASTCSWPHIADMHGRARVQATLLLALGIFAAGAAAAHSAPRWSAPQVVGPSKPIWNFAGDPLAVGGDGSVFAAWRKRYDLEGRWISAPGTRGQVLSLASSRGFDPTILPGPRGSMFLTWQAFDAGQWLRTWSPSGALGPEHELTSDYPCVSVLPRGGNLGCLHAPADGTTGIPFLFDVFTPSGTRAASVVVANPPHAGVQGTEPGSLGAGANGGTLVTWAEANATCCDGRSLARVVHPDGSLGAVMTISGRARAARPVVDRRGRIAFFFDAPAAGGRVRHRVRWFGEDGSPLGPARDLSRQIYRGSEPVRLGLLGNGGVVAVWQESVGPRDSRSQVVARVVTPRRSTRLRTISSPTDRYSVKVNIGTSRGEVHVVWLFLRSPISGAARVGLRLRTFSRHGSLGALQTLVPLGQAGYTPMPHIDGNRRGDLAVLYKSKAGMAVRTRRR
jgi:hypothetical protein